MSGVRTQPAMSPPVHSSPPLLPRRIRAAAPAVGHCPETLDPKPVPAGVGRACTLVDCRRHGLDRAPAAEVSCAAAFVSWAAPFATVLFRAAGRV